MSERWGAIEGMSLKFGVHSIDFSVDDDLGFALSLSGRHGGPDLGDAEGGYLLMRLNPDGEEYTVVTVDPPAGWWPGEGKAPADLVRRGAEYLTALADKLEQIEALGWTAEAG